MNYKDRYGNILKLGDNVLLGWHGGFLFPSTVCNNNGELEVPHRTVHPCRLKDENDRVILLYKFTDYGDLIKVDDYFAKDKDGIGYALTSKGVVQINVRYSKEV